MELYYGDAEKLIKDVYWSETHDKANKINIPAIIGDRLIKDNEEKDPEYYNHRPGVIHVSSLSKCLCGVVHEMLGTEKDVQDPQVKARKLGVFKAGNLFEDFIVDALGDMMLDRQTEYVWKLPGDSGVIVTGRDDGTMWDAVGQCQRMLECKSVHSDSFWHREKAGELVAYQNQMQIQTYLHFRRVLPNMFVVLPDGVEQDGEGVIPKEIIYTNLTRQELWEYRGSKPTERIRERQKPDNSNLNGVFTYISKDDCTIIQAPVQYNPRIIETAVMPALNQIVQAYQAKNPKLAPLPPLVRYEVSKGQWTKNWLCTYCEYHTKCAGAGWVMEAMNEVKRLNAEQNAKMVNSFQRKAPAPTIAVAPDAKPIIGVDLANGTDKGVMVEGKRNPDGTVIIEKITELPPAPTGETSLERMVRENRERQPGFKSIATRMREAGRMVDTEGLSFDGDVGISGD